MTKRVDFDVKVSLEKLGVKLFGSFVNGEVDGPRRQVAYGDGDKTSVQSSDPIFS